MVAQHNQERLRPAELHRAGVDPGERGGAFYSEAAVGLIAFAMLMVVLSIGVFGPRTRDLELEQIST